MPQDPRGDERGADAQHHSDDDGFVPGILQRLIPLPGRLQDLKAKTQRQERGGKQSAERAHEGIIAPVPHGRGSLDEQVALGDYSRPRGGFVLRTPNFPRLRTDGMLPHSAVVVGCRWPRARRLWRPVPLDFPHVGRTMP